MFEKYIKERQLIAVKKMALQLLSEKGESNARSMAVKLIENYTSLDRQEQLKFFEFLAEKLSPDPEMVFQAAKLYKDKVDELSLIELQHVADPPRQELFRRLNRAESGTKTIISMRESVLGHLKVKPKLRALDADIEHLLTSWFNPGFLELHEITWSSPANLLEKIIKHESVHAIDGWEDLRRRLQPDRRCFAFFHPQLPQEPLIFVEVALVADIAKEVGALLDKRAPTLDAKKYKTAIFYSISNCQPGLKGVSLGNFLIKRVAERIQKDIPSVKTFSTLSPVPGFLKWLDSGVNLSSYDLSSIKNKKLEKHIACLQLPKQSWIKKISDGWNTDKSTPEEKAALLGLCFLYLTRDLHSSKGDAVARFHLANGARLYSVNWAADLSKKGLAQSCGIMVNYLYELPVLENNHQAYINEEVIYSTNLEKLI